MIKLSGINIILIAVKSNRDQQTMLVKINAGAVQGFNAIPITIEVNVAGTIVGQKISYYFVGLPDNAIREGYQRIEAAIGSKGRKMPRQKIVVNMAPGNVQKERSDYERPSGIGIQN